MKEYVIGFDVFDKGSDFDPRSDPIVRVEAGRLRHKVREYYDTVGAHDPIWLGLGRRGYRPQIRARHPVHRPASKNPAPIAASRDSGAAEERLAAGPSVAVLPFTDMSPDDGQRFFCRALTDQIANSIARGRKLNAVGRTSSEHLASCDDIPAIGEKTHADAVLEGSVQQVGARVRVRVQLVSVESGLDIWADTYDREIRDVFATQDDLTEKIVAGLESVLLHEARTESAAGVGAAPCNGAPRSRVNGA